MEALMFSVDKGPAEDHYKAGDIITICPDGWPWSPAELSNPDWRIIRVNILKTQADAFLARSQNEAVKRRREWQIDISKLPNPALFVGPRTQGIITLTRGQVVSAAVKKP